MTLVFASANAHKIDEIRAMLPKGFTLLGLHDIGCYDDIPETADTFEGNAQLKADYVTQKFGYDCFADDSGLEVDALGGAPGVYSARYAGMQKSDSDNIKKLLSELNDMSERTARFKTVIALNLRGERYFFSGTVEGKIINEPIGSNGFGYDPVFIADGFDKTFAQISKTEKAAVSHRGRAVQRMMTFLESVQ